VWASIPLKSKWERIIGIERRRFESCNISNSGKISGGMRKNKGHRCYKPFEIGEGENMISDIAVKTVADFFLFGTCRGEP
jgi:hypothetical protein